MPLCIAPLCPPQPPPRDLVAMGEALHALYRTHAEDMRASGRSRECVEGFLQTMLGLQKGRREVDYTKLSQALSAKEQRVSDRCPRSRLISEVHSLTFPKDNELAFRIHPTWAPAGAVREALAPVALPLATPLAAPTHPTPPPHRPALAPLTPRPRAPRFTRPTLAPRPSSSPVCRMRMCASRASAHRTQTTRSRAARQSTASRSTPHSSGYRQALCRPPTCASTQRRDRRATRRRA